MKQKKASDLLNAHLGADDVQAAIVLKFIRAVGTDKIVGAFVDGLTDKKADEKYKKDLESFKKALLSRIPSSGTKVNDEIEFMFKGRNAEEMCLKVNKSDIECFKNSKLRQALMDIYTGSKAVTPELSKNLLKSL